MLVNAYGSLPPHDTILGYYNAVPLPILLSSSKKQTAQIIVHRPEDLGLLT